MNITRPQVVTTYTVEGFSSKPSGTYTFALPADVQDHLAFLSVTMDEVQLIFRCDGPSSGEGDEGEALVLYTAGVWRPKDKEEVKIAVGIVCSASSSFVGRCILVGTGLSFCRTAS